MPVPAHACHLTSRTIPLHSTRLVPHDLPAPLLTWSVTVGTAIFRFSVFGGGPFSARAQAYPARSLRGQKAVNGLPRLVVGIFAYIHGMAKHV